MENALLISKKKHFTNYMKNVAPKERVNMAVIVEEKGMVVVEAEVVADEVAAEDMVAEVAAGVEAVVLVSTAQNNETKNCSPPNRANQCQEQRGQCF
jgi:hypothetical protein